ncbi:MAG: UvrD-helicase domain-containing protein, partial [Myxococcales bacterium]|nr:UvrD-helicase domain-containing protein [Myxococcales bacterium]
MIQLYQMANNTVIRASAGTGKTFTLVETIVHLLGGVTHHRVPLSPRSIVAITFTERAAGEMLERVRTRIGQLATGQPEAENYLRQSAEMLGVPVPGRDLWLGVANSIDQLRLNTFHGFCLSLLQRYPLEAGLDPGFGIYDIDLSIARIEALAELETVGSLQDQPDEELLILLKEMGLSRGERAGLLRLLPDLLSKVRESGYVRAEEPVGASIERRYGAAIWRVLDRLSNRFDQEKRRVAQIDFSDMQQMARQLLAAHPDVRREVKENISVLLVDEFQDTNPIQRDLTLLLAEEAAAQTPWPSSGMPSDYQIGSRRLFVVGDPKQAIYNFRGADVSVFHEVEERVLNQGGDRFALQTNYRSRPTLVDSGNQLLSEVLSGEGLDDAPWVVRWEPSDEMNAARKALDVGKPVHLLDSETLCAERCAEKGRAGGTLFTVEEEFSVLAEALLDFVTPSPTALRVDDGAGGTRPARFSDVNILMRRFTNLDELTYQLERRGIPHYVVKGIGLYGAREVTDVANGLMAMAHSCDPITMTAWLRGPMIGFSDETLLSLTKQFGRVSAENVSKAGRTEAFLESLRDNSQRERVSHASQLLRELGRMGESLGPWTTLELLLERTNFYDVLAARADGDQALSNIERVSMMADRYQKRIGHSLTGFAHFLMHQVERDIQTEAPQVVTPDQNVVRVMTIHQSKGLECPIAIVPECHMKVFKANNRIMFSPDHGLGVRASKTDDWENPVHAAATAELNSREAAEHQRLMYVAFTRARDHVVLSGSTRMGKNPKKDGPAYVPNTKVDGVYGWNSSVHKVKRDGASWLDSIAVAGYLGRCGTASVERPDIDIARGVDALERVRQPLDQSGEVVVAVTQLGDFARCPRRYWFEWVAGLDARYQFLLDASGTPESSVEQDGRDGAPQWPMDPLDLGTLAHALLENAEIDMVRASAGDGKAYLASLTSSFGNTLAVETSEVVERVHRTLVGPVGDWVSAPNAHRELGFLLRVPNSSGQEAHFIRGQIDLALLGDDPTVIIDYKYTDPNADLSRYMFQLKCYALAAHQLLGRPAAMSYRVGIVFLKTAEPEPRFHPTLLDATELNAFEAELGSLCDQ